MGDLAFRFPNAMEPWTSRMYARLSDDSQVVRYNTLMVLTHLILNDMVKVKGQVRSLYRTTFSVEHYIFVSFTSDDTILLVQRYLPLHSFLHNNNLRSVMW